MKITKTNYIIATIAITIILALTIQFEFNGDLDGIYLLRGEKRYQLIIKDDLLLGEYQRLILKFEFDSLLKSFHKSTSEKLGRSSTYLKYKWNAINGSGYFESYFPNGTKFVTCLGRFIDDDKKHVHGLFVGGGLPTSDYESNINLNETGVAYYDGKKWQHIWCIANEVLFSVSSPLKAIPPSDWTFIGSRVINASQDDLVIKSSHMTPIDGIPIQIDRYLIYNSENKFFHLIVRLTNVGLKTVTYNYMYGDEPWIGDYGSSKGNVGWTKKQIYNYETAINPADHDFIGMYDIGNVVIGEKSSDYTGLANFIEWQGGERPDYAYFANETGKIIDSSNKVPLNHNTNRLLMVQWAQRTINPGDSRTMVIVIGMANNSTDHNFPSKPKTDLNSKDLEYILSQ